MEEYSVSGKWQIPFELLEMSGKVTYDIIVSVCRTHKLVVSGIILIEEHEQVTVFPEGSKTPSRTMIKHTRRIGDRDVTVQLEKGRARKKMTDMSPEELDKFDAQWKELWHPKMRSSLVLKKHSKDEEDESNIVKM
jgi:hypothetical protein